MACVGNESVTVSEWRLPAAAHKLLAAVQTIPEEESTISLNETVLMLATITDCKNGIEQDLERCIAFGLSFKCT